MSFGPYGPVLPVTWYFTAPGAPAYPDWHVYSSLDWVRQDIDPGSPLAGEVWPKDRKWANGKPVPGACDDYLTEGTVQQFQGAPTQPDRPPCIPGDVRGPGPYSCEYSTEYA